MLHSLKIEPQYLTAIINKKKLFEVRKNDRDYKVGDYLELKEFTNGDYTDRSILVQITYVLDNPNYCKANYVILGIVPINIEVF